MGKYDDIIDMPHHEPDQAKHPRMSIEQRAAQFAPFAALTGQGEIIKDVVRGAEEEALNDLEREEIGDDI